jgi:hypothetical protein
MKIRLAAVTLAVLSMAFSCDTIKPRTQETTAGGGGGGPTAPAKPSGVAAVGISSSQISVSWIDVGGAEDYLIERSPDHGTSWTSLPTVPQGSQSDTDGGLSANAVYSYRVTATNSAGSSAPSPMVTAQTLCSGQASTTVYSGSNAGFYTDLVLSGSTEYISHYDASHTGVLVTAGGTTVLADSGPSSGSVVGSDGTSIALSGRFIQTVEHHTTTNGTTVNKLRSATSGPGTLSFTSGVADPNSYPSGGFPKIRVNPLPSPNGMMIYTAVFSGATTLVTTNGNPVDTTSCTSFSGTSLSYDPLGNWHAAYTRTATGTTGTQLVYAYKPPSSTSFGNTVLTPTGNPTDVSIVGYENPSNQGVAHIAYYESTGKRLMHAWRPDLSTPWMAEVIDSTTSADVGAYCSIAMTPSINRLHVAYYDRVNGDLRYARKDGSGPWVLLLIDAQGNVGTYTSIAVDGAGQVHIAYRDETYQALKVAVGTP